MAKRKKSSSGVENDGEKAADFR